MTIRIHSFQHVPFEGLGSIGAWAEDAGHRITTTRFYDSPDLPATDRFDWLVVMGGPMGVHDEPDFHWLAWEKELIYQAIERQKVVLGICLGAQLIAEVLGAEVYPNAEPEIGWFEVKKTAAARTSALNSVFPDIFVPLHWHGDTFDLPDGAIHLARSNACENQAFVYDGRVVGLQFHLEIGPKGLDRLIMNCRDELQDSPCVQTPETMLSPQRPYNQNRAIMDRLLDDLSRVR